MFNIPIAMILGSTVSDTVAARVSMSPALLRAGCALGIQGCCTWFAKNWEVDPRRREQLFMKACQTGHAGACLELGYHHSGERSHGVQALMRLPFDERERFEISSRAYLDSIRDDVKAAELYQKGCNLGDAGACYELGRAFMAGLGVPQDQERSMAAWRRSCELFKGIGCNALAAAYRLRGDEATARELDRRGYDEGLPFLFWLGLAGLAASLVLGVLVQLGLGTMAVVGRPKSWTLVTAVCTGLFFLAGVFQLSWGDAAWIGWIFLLVAAAFLIGTFLLRTGRYRAARLLLAVTGFLSLPTGVFAILVSREVAESADAPSLKRSGFSAAPVS